MIPLQDDTFAILSTKFTSQIIERGLRLGSNKYPVSYGPDGKYIREDLPATDLTAHVKTTSVSEALQVMRQEVTIENHGECRSARFDSVAPFYVSLDVSIMDRPWARALGGGTTQGFYPPPAYQESLVAFGAAGPRIAFADPRGGHRSRDFAISSGQDGRSSNKDLPILQFGWDSKTGPVGLWLAIEWSGTWSLQVHFNEYGKFELIADLGGVGLELEPGQMIQLPAVHIGVFEGDHVLGGNSLRRYINQFLTPALGEARVMPIVGYDHWFDIGPNISDPALRRQADRAGELGLEVFVVDAGWYGQTPGRDLRSNFGLGVGNWDRTNSQGFPAGLKPLSEYVRSKGMRFGLWFEVERAHQESDWSVAHPEWYLPVQPGNEYLHLNLTVPAAQDAVIELLSSYIRDLDLTWLRMDYNLGPQKYWDSADPIGMIQFEYFRGLYRVYDSVLATFPDVVIECCASGGRRIDFGMLSRTHAAVYSDHADDPHICRIMQTGAARFLPGNVPTSSMAVRPNEGDAGFNVSALLSRMAGGMLFCGDIASWGADFTSDARRVVEIFKAYRYLLLEDFYPLSDYPRTPDAWDVVQFTDPQTTDSVVLAYRMSGSVSTYSIRMRSLDADLTYLVESPFEERWELMTGSALMGGALEVSAEPDGAAIRLIRPQAPSSV